jgi:ABC-type antimicrobial peptide transport system permease subunit
VQRRAREIVLRKLYGADGGDVALLVLREIGALCLAGALIALPVAALVIARHLSTYVERAPIGYWTLLAALGATLLVALAAVARHARIAMRMRPAAALRM